MLVSAGFVLAFSVENNEEVGISEGEKVAHLSGVVGLNVVVLSVVSARGNVEDEPGSLAVVGSIVVTPSGTSLGVVSWEAAVGAELITLPDAEDAVAIEL